MHWSAELETKVYDPRKEKGRTDRPTEGSTERVNSLAHLTPILHSAKYSKKRRAKNTGNDVEDLPINVFNMLSVLGLLDPFYKLEADYFSPTHYSVKKCNSIRLASGSRLKLLDCPQLLYNNC